MRNRSGTRCVATGPIDLSGRSPARLAGAFLDPVTSVLDHVGALRAARQVWRVVNPDHDTDRSGEADPWAAAEGHDGVDLVADFRFVSRRGSVGRVT